jgi:pre-rRNA-processing protein IPI1
MDAQAGAIIDKVVEHVTDADSGVRSALRDLLRDVVLPCLGPAALAPFTPLIMAHTTSAMTHLADAVRYDYGI